MTYVSRVLIALLIGTPETKEHSWCAVIEVAHGVSKNLSTKLSLKCLKIMKIVF